MGKSRQPRKAVRFADAGSVRIAGLEPPRGGTGGGAISKKQPARTARSAGSSAGGRRKPAIVTTSSRLRKGGRATVTAAAAAAAGAVITPRALARARLGSARRQASSSTSGGGGSGAPAAAAMRSSLRPTEAAAAAAAADGEDLDGLCAAFTTTRLRVHDIRVDRPTGFVRSLVGLMPLPPLTDYTINLKNRSIGADSVVTASVLPTPAPRPRKGTPEAIALAAAAAAAPPRDPSAPPPSNGKLQISSTKLGARNTTKSPSFLFFVFVSVPSLSWQLIAVHMMQRTLKQKMLSVLAPQARAATAA